MTDARTAVSDFGGKVKIEIDGHCFVLDPAEAARLADGIRETVESDPAIPEKPFTCDGCGEGFLTEHAYDDHQCRDWGMVPPVTFPPRGGDDA